MTHAEIRDAIAANAEWQALVRTDTGALSVLMSEGRTRLVERLIGYGTVQKYLGAELADTLLTAMEATAETNSVVARGLALLEKDALDVSLAEVRAMLDTLLASYPDAADTLKGLAGVDDPVTVQQILKAVEGIYE